MTEGGSREEVLALFEKHRETPGTPYDGEHFVDFLIAHPKGKRAVHNSFRGLRRYNAFIDELQYEFGICFSVKDRDATYSIDRFVQRVEELRNNPRSSLAALRAQMNRGIEGIVFIGPLMFVVGALAFHKDTVVALGLLGCGVVLAAILLIIHRRSKRYLVRLQDRIKSAK